MLSAQENAETLKLRRHTFRGIILPAIGSLVPKPCPSRDYNRGWEFGTTHSIAAISWSLELLSLHGTVGPTRPPPTTVYSEY